jgi:diketogulonate reductase-like aldo/keto reductase
LLFFYCCASDYSSTKHTVLLMLEKLGVVYFDLLLLHYPLASGTGSVALSGDPAALCTSEKWNTFTSSLPTAWTHLSLLRQEGLVRQVGLSNCYTQHLKAWHSLIPASLDSAPLYAVQNYIDAAHDEPDLLAYCQKHHIHCLAYRPLVFMSVYGLLDGVLDQLQEAASAHGMDDCHQLVLLWLLSRGISPVVSSMDTTRMSRNFSTGEKYQKHHHVSMTERDNRVAEEINETLRRVVAGQREVIDMMGGCDEYALAFREMRGHHVCTPTAEES